MKYKFLFLLAFLLPSFAFCQSFQGINYSLNSSWKFHKGDLDQNQLQATTDWQTINLPHTWNATDPFDDTPGYYRGIGWYTKNMIMPKEWEGKKVYLYFKGVNQEAEVIINDHPVGTHQGGYTAFCFDITPYIKYGVQNAIAVKVDNSFNKDIPPLNADFNFYGGIYRGVEIIVKNPVHFDMNNHASSGVFIETPVVSEKQSDVLVRGKLTNETNQDQKVEVRSVIYDKNHVKVGEDVAVLKIPSKANLEFEKKNITIHNPILWSPQVPYLYSVYTTIKDPKTHKTLDEVVNPLGCRWFSIHPGDGFYLNGRKLPLLGASRHQDFMGMGNALTPEMHRHDFEMIKAMGANFVRLAHYPQDPEVYKACDELGLLVWSEIPVVNAITASDDFFNTCKNMQTEQIRQTYNHPSVVIYGFMNEIFIKMVTNNKLSKADRDKNIETTLKLAHELNTLTKSEAPGRLTAMAMHYDPIYDETGISSIPDIAGWNLYFGWYYDKLADFGKFLDTQHAKYPNRAMIISEYGADTDERNFTFTPKRWDFSADFQYVLHTSYLNQFRTRPFMVGMAAWNFADFGAEGRQDAIPFINKKGLVNYDRRPKDSYYLYQANLSAKPVIHIVTYANAQRAGVADQANGDSCLQPVRIFTNKPFITLTVNGRSLGRKEVKERQVTFNVPFIAGTNKIKAVADDGMDEEANIQFKLIPHLLNSPKFTSLAVNVGSHQYFWDKINHVTWIPEQPYKPGQWGYIGGTVYSPDSTKHQGIPSKIEGTINHPLFQSLREGIQGFKFDVADGKYQISLLFAEPGAGNRKTLVYDLSKAAGSAADHAGREFDIFINHQKVISNLNLARDYGALHAVTITTEAIATNNEGLDIKFSPISGQAVLSGIKLVRVSN
jgi:beta-galactosidase